MPAHLPAFPTPCLPRPCCLPAYLQPYYPDRTNKQTNNLGGQTLIAPGTCPTQPAMNMPGGGAVGRPVLNILHSYPTQTPRQEQLPLFFCCLGGLVGGTLVLSTSSGCQTCSSAIPQTNTSQQCVCVTSKIPPPTHPGWFVITCIPNSSCVPYCHRCSLPNSPRTCIWWKEDERPSGHFGRGRSGRVEQQELRDALWVNLLLLLLVQLLDSSIGLGS